MKKRVSGICLLFITACGHLSLWNTINGVIYFCYRKCECTFNWDWHCVCGNTASYTAIGG